jgi:hypothetical protein
LKVYRWELDEAAQPAFAALRPEVRAMLTEFMDAVVIVDPIEYQRSGQELTDRTKMLRTLPFGQHHQGLVTFLVYPPDDLVLVVRIQWFGE